MKPWTWRAIVGGTVVIGVAYLYVSYAAIKKTLQLIPTSKAASRGKLVQEWRAAGFAWTESDLRRPKLANDGIALLPAIRKEPAGRPGPETLALLRGLAEADGFSRNLAPFDVELPAPDAKTVRDIADGLAAQAVRSARAGDLPAAEADLRRAIRIAELVERTDGGIERAVAASIRFRAGRAAAVAMVGRPNADRTRLREAARHPLRPIDAGFWRSDAFLMVYAARKDGADEDGWPKNRKLARNFEGYMREWMTAKRDSNDFRDRAVIERHIAAGKKRMGGYESLFPLEIVQDIERREKTASLLLDTFAAGKRSTPPDAWGRPIRWAGQFPYSLGPDGKDQGGIGRKDISLAPRPKRTTK